MIIFWILGCIAGYLFIGFILACILLKKEGKCFDKIDAENDLFLPVFFWPLFVLFVCGVGISWLSRNAFRLVAIYVLRIPATSESETESGFVQGFEHGGGSNPPPKTAKPKVTPPSQKKDKVPTPRFNLIDMD